MGEFTQYWDFNPSNDKMWGPEDERRRRILWEGERMDRLRGPLPGGTVVDTSLYRSYAPGMSKSERGTVRVHNRRVRRALRLEEQRTGRPVSKDEQGGVASAYRTQRHRQKKYRRIEAKREGLWEQIEEAYNIARHGGASLLR